MLSSKNPINLASPKEEARGDWMGLLDGCTVFNALASFLRDYEFEFREEKVLILKLMALNVHKQKTEKRLDSVK